MKAFSFDNVTLGETLSYSDERREFLNAFEYIWDLEGRESGHVLSRGFRFQQRKQVLVYCHDLHSMMEKKTIIGLPT